MDELFAKYEHELVILRSLCREYAERYPKVAAQLQMGGDACDDPHVERLIQAVALLCARVTKRLDDNYPQFTEALLNLLFPHYLRPFPSCAIARVGSVKDGTDGAGAAMARGTRLQTRSVKGIACTFTTAYDVVPSSAQLTVARFAPLVTAPTSLRLPDDAYTSVSLRFAAAGGHALTAPAAPLRFYIDGDPAFCATLRDALFVDLACVYVQFDDDGPWTRLAATPLAPVGFADNEALIPFGARSHAAYRVLAEYFAFPDKFNFVDIDLAPALMHAKRVVAHLTLHLILRGIRPDADRARLLANLSPANLLQGCTPVVNLFSQPGVPITLDQRKAEYTVLAHGCHPQGFKVVGLRVIGASGNTLFSWPRQGESALESIYLQPANRWWRLINPLWVNPAERTAEDGGGIEAVMNRLKSATMFLDSIQHTFHPTQSYASFCASDVHKCFGDIVFKIMNRECYAKDIPSPETWTLISEDKLGTLKVRAGEKVLDLKLQRGEEPGDETVPSDRSASKVKGIMFKHGTIKAEGYEHQDSYSHPHVLASMLYSIVKIAGTAKWD